MKLSAVVHSVEERVRLVLRRELANMKEESRQRWAIIHSVEARRGYWIGGAVYMIASLRFLFWDNLRNRKPLESFERTARWFGFNS